MLALWILFLLATSVIGLIGFAAFSNKKAEDLLPPAGKFVQLGDTRLHYVDQGQGPAILIAVIPNVHPMPMPALKLKPTPL
jgi:hypothetical protein